MKKFQITIDDGKYLQQWIKNPKNSLLFLGLPGRGKTYSAKILNDFIPKYLSKEFWNMADLTQKWLSNMGSYQDNYYFLDYLKKVDVLVLDDLGVREPSPGFLDFIYSLINHRQDNPELITIYTTNLSSKQINDFYGSRMVSRIFASKTIKFIGDDWRLNPPKEDVENVEKEERLNGLYQKHKEEILNEIHHPR